MSSTPPGWYDDGHGARRWWNGVGWTEHVESAAPASLATPGPPAGPGYPPVTPAKKSRLWIVWTVLGVVALGAVIAAIVLIPMALAGLMGASGGDGGGVEPSTPDEAAAVETVRQYDQAWQQVDCDLFLAVTTEEFRDELELPDCAAFVDSAQYFVDSTSDYVVEVTGTSTDGDVITVFTTETFMSSVDDDGEPLDEPAPGEDRWEYYLISSGDAWVIDDVGGE
ncbi:DUF2510 domain-containing protein [Microbacterium sp. SS28]|uniref:DUF2510 domain-containing protein n=1 Tax=Microbacterium sp. SS28 TaxID=2919948 RepID=UPI001FA9F2E6|nr:DUF2510 domain-containing protein [Microbacterium sp. SS28]